MNTKIQKSVLAGIIGTVVMTLIMKIAPMMGMPKMSPPEMLAGMMGMPIAMGWIMHFIIGIIFGLGYTYVCIFKHKISNVYLKGAVYGVVVFIFAQVMMKIMSMMMPMPENQGNMLPMLMGSLIGHIIFGIVVAKVVGNAYCSTCKTETTK